MIGMDFLIHMNHSFKHLFTYSKKNIYIEFKIIVEKGNMTFRSFSLFKIKFFLRKKLVESLRIHTRLYTYIIQCI